MRVRPIDDLDRLRDAVTMIDAAFPLWSERTGRDFRYFARRFPSDGSLYLTLEDAAGTIGVALPTVEKDVVVLDTEFVAPSADSPSARAIVANAISAAAVAMNATRMAVPAGSQLAETYEEIQHLAPVRARVRLPGDAGDLGRIRSAVDRIDRLDPRRTFAVQCRKRRTARSPARMTKHRTARET